MVVSLLKETCVSCGHYSWPQLDTKTDVWECAACGAATLSDEALAELLEIIEDEEKPKAQIYSFPSR